MAYENSSSLYGVPGQVQMSHGHCLKTSWAHPRCSEERVQELAWQKDRVGGVAQQDRHGW
jgi:hypothetical protein